MRIGILGGTFDPPHLGHLELARAAKSHLYLDSVMFVPSSQNPFKKRRHHQTPARKRFDMVRLMLEGEESMLVTDVEITRGGPSYMVETLEELQLVMPGEYWLILGGDNLERFMEWFQAERILRTTRLAVAARPGTDVEAIARRQSEVVQRQLDFIPIEPNPTSSTVIREKLKQGRSVEGMLHPAVETYIRENGLYPAE